MYCNTLEHMRQMVIGADERASLDPALVARITVEDMIMLNRLIEGDDQK